MNWKKICWWGLSTVICAMFLIAGLFLPPTVRYTHQPDQSQCRNNLRLLAAVKTQWALENHKTADALPTQEDLLPYLGRSGWPECAASGKYVIGIVSAAPTCSKPGHVLPK